MSFEMMIDGQKWSIEFVPYVEGALTIPEESRILIEKDLDEKAAKLFFVYHVSHILSDMRELDALVEEYIEKRKNGLMEEAFRYD